MVDPLSAPAGPQPPPRRPTRPALRVLHNQLGALAWSVANFIAPSWTAARHRRQHAAWFIHSDLPLFALPGHWRGTRRLGGVAGFRGRRQSPTSSMLGLAHEDPDGATLSVETYRRAGHAQQDPHLRLALNLWREAALDLPNGRPGLGGDPSALHAFLVRREAALAAGELIWDPVEVLVDDTPKRFLMLREGQWWVARGEVDGVDVVLRGQRFPIERVELVRLASLEPYLTNH